MVVALFRSKSNMNVFIKVVLLSSYIISSILSFIVVGKIEIVYVMLPVALVNL